MKDRYTFIGRILLITVFRYFHTDQSVHVRVIILRNYYERALGHRSDSLKHQPLLKESVIAKCFVRAPDRYWTGFVDLT